MQRYLIYSIFGEVPERSNGAVSKTVDPYGSQGSNPCLSGFYNFENLHTRWMEYQ